MNGSHMMVRRRKGEGRDGRREEKEEREEEKEVEKERGRGRIGRGGEANEDAHYLALTCLYFWLPTWLR